MEQNLSQKEQNLLNFIKTSKEKVTAKLIELQLGKDYLGAMGRLIGLKLIEIKKDRASGDSYAGKKMIKYYMIKDNLPKQYILGNFIISSSGLKNMANHMEKLYGNEDVELKVFSIDIDNGKKTIGIMFDKEEK